MCEELLWKYMENEKNLVYFSYYSQTVTDRNLILAVHIEYDQ
jgi:hypothetical protein